MKRALFSLLALATFCVVTAVTRNAHAFCAFGCSPDRQCQPGCPPEAPVPGTISANHSIIHFNSCGGPYSFDPSATPANGCPETCDTHHNGDVPDGYYVVKSSTPGQPPATNIPFQFLDQGQSAPPGYTFNDKIVPRTITGKKDSGKAGHDIGINEGRLRSDLRQVARTQEPLQCALPLAAIQYASSDPNDRLLGQAYADLAVTGRNAFAQFRAAFQSPSDDAKYCASLNPNVLPADQGLTASTRVSCPRPHATMPTHEQLVAGCHLALYRAHLVANYLRAGEDVRVGLHGAGTAWFDADGQPSLAAATERARKLQQRAELGWIAVSGEDDLPHRPVNAPSSDFPQYDITVQVEAPQASGPKMIAVQSRYTVAQSRGPAAPNRGSNEWLANPLPQIPGGDAQILIFVHGMDSRAEEANDITQELFKLRDRMHINQNLVVIAVDLPTSGYAQTLDHRTVSDLSVVGHDSGVNSDYWFNGPTPLLDFIEQFIVSFVDTLDKEVPIKSRIKAVMGGSLGGNMSFRLGRRPNTPWLPRVIVWSPASIWESLGAGADFTKHQGPKKAMDNAAQFDANDPDDLSPGRLGRRKDFFASWDQPTFQVLGIPLIPGLDVAQSDTWESDYYLCKQSGIAGARLDRHETYDARFLTWRWRLGGEQLLSSHVAIDPATKMPRYMSNCKPMLLSCGLEDHVPYNDICPGTQAIPPYMRQTPGRALFFDKTGHSLDNERRAYFASEVQKFLGEPWAPSACTGPEKKPDGQACALGDECASNWCYGFKCQTKHTKPNGSVCAIPDECESNRCIITCQAQPPPPHSKADGASCGTGDECVSSWCYGFKCQTKHTKPNGSVCAIPDECESNRCIVTCQAQPPPPHSKPEDAGCATGDECASNWCYGFKCQTKHTKPNGAACAIPDECASNRCNFFKCEAQPQLKSRGEGCTLPGECASHKCDFLEGVFKGLKCY